MRTTAIRTVIPARATRTCNSTRSSSRSAAPRRSSRARRSAIRRRASFLLLDGEGNQYTVELQDGTRYFGPDGELGEDAIVIGASLEIEGVIPEKADPADPDVIRAALVFIAADEDVQLSGTIKAPLDATARSFNLATDTGDVCVNVQDEADILLVSGVSSTVTVGSFTDLVVDQVVDVFGTMDDTGGCLLANEVIVTVD